MERTVHAFPLTTDPTTPVPRPAPSPITNDPAPAHAARRRARSSDAPRPGPDRTDAERWEAVRRRDAACDGAFVYAVRTTGVYCRPSCASRPARRENVSFFEAPAAAAAAGFRACRRCRPDEAPLGERHRALVLEACDALARSESGLPLDALARAQRAHATRCAPRPASPTRSTTPASARRAASTAAPTAHSA